MSERWDSHLFGITSLSPNYAAILPPWSVTSGTYMFPLVTRLCLRSFISSALTALVFYFFFSLSVCSFAVQVQSRIGFSDQWTFKAVGKHNLHSIWEEWEVQTNLPQLHTKSLICLSAHHFSDSDNSTKSMQYPWGRTGREVSELTSHIKNTRNQPENEN